MSFGGVLTSELRGLPWAMLNVLPFNQGFESAPPGFKVKPARSALGRQRDRLLWLVYRAWTSPFTHAYNRARAQIGLPKDRRPYGRVLFSDWLVLATGCPGLDEPRPDLPDAIHFVGRLEPAGAKLSSAASGELTRPLVVVTQGTLELEYTEVIGPALEGLADLEVEVIATSGRRGQTDVGLALPANARVVDLLDFGSVLPRASVFVTNGGWGGVLASLAAGVPLVVAAGVAGDKPEIAARVARSGAGINLRTGRPKPSAVADAVREILANPSYAKRAREIAAELDQLGGASAAADLLERLAETRTPVRRIGNPWSSTAT
jgi:UDP:flavonoid glycosyltransferase YjiC (YdhE family)